jgi:hypothetical protein
VVPAPVLPEVDHLLGQRLGKNARLTFYRGLCEGHLFVADLPQEGYLRVQELNRQFEELDLGFVDAGGYRGGPGSAPDRNHGSPAFRRPGRSIIPGPPSLKA